MPNPAQLIDPRTAETLDIMGSTVQFLVPPEDGVPLVMRGSIPPGGFVPLHSHAEPETFFGVSGELEGLADSGWVRVGPGDVFHVPGGTKHAWRNRSGEAAAQIAVSTARLGRFFREVAGNSSVEHFFETSARYGYWNATPEENAEVGLPAM